MVRRALIVGIIHYDNVPGAELHGAIPDAQAMDQILSTNFDGSPNYETMMLVSSPDEPITRAFLRNTLDDLFRSPDDEVLFYFSGHGSITNAGGYIVTQDAQPGDIGLPMDELLNRAN